MRGVAKGTVKAIGLVLLSLIAIGVLGFFLFSTSLSFGDDGNGMINGTTSTTTTTVTVIPTTTTTTIIIPEGPISSTADLSNGGKTLTVHSPDAIWDGKKWKKESDKDLSKYFDIYYDKDNAVVRFSFNDTTWVDARFTIAMKDMSSVDCVKDGYVSSGDLCLVDKNTAKKALKEFTHDIEKIVKKDKSGLEYIMSFMNSKKKLGAIKYVDMEIFSSSSDIDLDAAKLVWYTEHKIVFNENFVLEFDDAIRSRVNVQAIDAKRIRFYDFVDGFNVVIDPTLTVNGGTFTICGYNATFTDKVEIINGGKLQICEYNGNPINCTSGINASGCGYANIVTSNFTVDSSSYIEGRAAGGRVGSPTKNGQGTGGECYSSTGYGHGGPYPGGASSGGAGGYGGNGGNGTGTAVADGGYAWNTSSNPQVFPGCGGGGGSYTETMNSQCSFYQYGDGGGAITINATYINIFGPVNMSGDVAGSCFGSSYCTSCGSYGGGSGGGILLWGKYISVNNSLLNAAGGDGGGGGVTDAGEISGGAGGGGRIKVFYVNLYGNTTASYMVINGSCTGGSNTPCGSGGIGSNGTLYFEQIGAGNFSIIPVVSLTATPSSPATYPSNVTVRCTATLTPYAGTLFRNGTNVTAIENNTVMQLPAGAWNYTCYIPGDGDYSSVTSNLTYNVNVGSWIPIVVSVLPSSPISYGASSNAQCIFNPNQTNVSLPTGGNGLAIALDSSGNQHVAFQNSSSANNLAYCTKSIFGTAWSCDYVASTGSSVGDSIAIDSNDKPHIAYRDSSADISYCNKTTGVWTCEKVFTTFSQDWLFGSIALDKDNNPHIWADYYQSSNNTYGEVYCNKTIGTWSCDIFYPPGVTDSNGLEYISTLFVDRNYDLYVAYTHVNGSTSTGAEIIFARRVNGTWNHTVVPGPLAWYATSPALEYDYVTRTAHIMYNDNAVYPSGASRRFMYCNSSSYDTNYSSWTCGMASYGFIQGHLNLGLGFDGSGNLWSTFTNPANGAWRIIYLTPGSSVWGEFYVTSIGNYISRGNPNLALRKGLVLNDTRGNYANVVQGKGTVNIGYHAVVSLLPGVPASEFGGYTYSSVYTEQFPVFSTEFSPSTLMNDTIFTTGESFTAPGSMPCGSNRTVYNNYTFPSGSNAANFEWRNMYSTASGTGWQAYVYNNTASAWQLVDSNLPWNLGPIDASRQNMINRTYLINNSADFNVSGVIVAKIVFMSPTGCPGTVYTVRFNESVLWRNDSIGIYVPDALVKLYRNGTDVTISEKNISTVLPGGGWNYTCVVPDTQNYTGSSSYAPYQVNGVNASVRAYPRTQSQTYEDTPLFQYCTSLYGTCQIFRNGTLLTNNTDVRLAAGSYEYKANISNTNYTEYQDIQYLTITKKNANVQVSPSNSTLTYPQSLSQSCTDDSTLYNCIVYRDEVLISPGSYSPAAGVYNYRSNISDYSNYTNYLATSQVTLNRASATATISVLPATPITYETQSTAVCSEDSPEASETLYRNGTNVSSLENNIAIYLPAGGWNYTCYVPETQNYTSDTDYQNYVVNKFDANVQVYPVTATQTYPQTVFQYCTDDSTFYTCGSYRTYNPSLGIYVTTPLTNGTSYSPAVIPYNNVYTYVANIFDSANYTNYLDTELYTLNPSQLVASLYLNGNLNSDTVVPNISLTATANISSNTNGLVPSLYRDGVYMGTVEIVSLPAGNYTYKSNATGNANYTSDSVGKSYKAIVTAPPIIVISIPVNGGSYLFLNVTPKSIPLNYTVTNLYPTNCYVWLNGVYTFISGCVNGTLNFTMIGNYNLTMNATETVGGTSGSAVSFFGVDFINEFNVYSLGGAHLNSGSITFTNSSGYSVSATLSNYSYFINTSQLPRGNTQMDVVFSNYISQVSNYTITNSTQFNMSISMINSALTLRVFGEDSLAAIPWYRVEMTNGTANASLAGSGVFTTMLSVGRGVPGSPQLSFLDDNVNTYTQSSANFSYQFGYTMANFTILYDVTNSSGSNNNISIDVWNVTEGAWVNVYTHTGGNANKTYETFTIDNRAGAAVFGDLYQICLTYYYCPLFQLSIQNEAGASVKVYDIKLVYPYTYDAQGFAQVNYTNFALVQGTSRFVFKTTINPFTSTNNYGLRTYFINPSQYVSTVLDAYLSPICNNQPFQVQDSSVYLSGSPLTIGGALVSVYRTFGSQSYVIDQQLSGATGDLSLCVEAGYPYVLTATAPGYIPGTWYEQVFSSATQTIYIQLAKTTLLSSIVNPYHTVLNITPSITNIYNSTNYTCFAQAPYRNAIYAYFQVAYQEMNTTYPNVNYTDYPPAFNWSTKPFGFNDSSYTVIYNSTVYSPDGGIFQINLNSTGRYSMECGLYVVPENETSYLNWTQPVHLFTDKGVWFLGDTGGGIVNVGKDLAQFVSGNTIWFVALLIDMMVSGFFVTKFGSRSAFIFLIIWGVMLTILGGWGLTVYTGIFIVACLGWLAMIFFPYRNTRE